MTTGADLRRERRAADITVVTLARHLGMSRQRLHDIEGRSAITDERAAQVRRALLAAIAEAQGGRSA